MKKSDFFNLLKIPGYIAGILFLASGCKSSADLKMQSEIDHIASRFVPDSRLGICTIKLKTAQNGSLVVVGETSNPEAKKAIINALDNHIKSLIDSIIILPDTIKNQRYLGLATLSVINLRKVPQESSELVSQARLGTPLLVLKSFSSWLLIQTPDGYISWTEVQSVKLMNRSEMADWKNAQKVICNSRTGWIYETPSVNSGVVGDLVNGDILVKEAEVKDFTSVILPDGRKGFIESKNVTDYNSWKINASCTGENVCKSALTFLGVPYLWGGSSIKGVDCSGFVQSVYFINGLILPRDASLIALHGTPIDISAGFSGLVKGDLLFFGSRNNGKPHVTHVAIYLGNNDYINSSGRVMINSLDSTKENFSKRIKALLEVKRIIGSPVDDGIVEVSKHSWY
jgi:SH3-like domain-containing protein